MTDYNKRRRERRVALLDKGMCPNHQDRPVAPGKRACQECLDRIARASKISHGMAPPPSVRPPWCEDCQAAGFHRSSSCAAAKKASAS